MVEITQNQRRFSRIGVIGSPNVGKSTFVNAIVGEKVSIVTSKAQTTRFVVQGIRNIGETQLVFFDTPGVFDARQSNKLEGYIVRNAMQVFKYLDQIIMMFDGALMYREYKKSGVVPNFLFDDYKRIATRLREVSSLRASTKSAKKPAMYGFKAVANSMGKKEQKLRLVFVINKYDVFKHDSQATEKIYDAILGFIQVSDLLPIHSPPSIAHEARQQSVDQVQHEPSDGNDQNEIYDQIDEEQREVRAKRTEAVKYKIPSTFADDARPLLISAATGEGMPQLLKYLTNSAYPSEWHFHDSQISDITEVQMAEELTREQLYKHLHKELPYSLKVETDLWKVDEDVLTIHQSVYVLKESQKNIIIGSSGAMIKKISQASREEIARVLDKEATTNNSCTRSKDDDKPDCHDRPKRHRVRLYLFVKVRPNWIQKLPTNTMK